MKWTPFWDSFKSAIHDSTQLEAAFWLSATNYLYIYGRACEELMIIPSL